MIVDCNTTSFHELNSRDCLKQRWDKVCELSGISEACNPCPSYVACSAEQLNKHYAIFPLTLLTLLKCNWQSAVFDQRYVLQSRRLKFTISLFSHMIFLSLLNLLLPSVLFLVWFFLNHCFLDVRQSEKDISRFGLASLLKLSLVQQHSWLIYSTSQLCLPLCLGTGSGQ